MRKTRERLLASMLLWLHYFTTYAVLSSPKDHHAITIPEKVIIGYTKQCGDSVIQSVIQGVNIVIWSSITISSSPSSPMKRNQEEDPFTAASTTTTTTTTMDARFIPIVKGGPNLNCVQGQIQQLHDMGYTDVLHLISIGGWNAAHFDFPSDSFTAMELYQTWKQYNQENIFHGFDWDFEGNDNLSSTLNYFDIECLNLMGEMSQFAKNDGYVVTMAPPESYLDFTTSHFSRYVNLTYPPVSWHDDFQYHGSNVYSYLLAKYGTFIDLISVQLYESYSHASYVVNELGISPSIYLVDFVNLLKQNLPHDEGHSILSSKFGNPGYWVNFSDDPSIELSNMFITIPMSKLVIGLATDWAKTQTDGKTVYISPTDIGKAYKEMTLSTSETDVNNNIEHDIIRGFMFWCICGDEHKLLEFVSGLNDVLEIRKNNSDVILELS